MKTPFLMKSLMVIAISMAAFGAYANTLRNGFVWDDHILIENNAFVRDWANVRKITSPSYYLRTTTERIENNSRPVWILSTLIDVKVWGLLPYGHHLTNVVVHVFNSLLMAVLVFLLLRSLGGSTVTVLHSYSAAFLAGVLFAVHPIHTEAVAAIGFRADLLVTFFYLAAFIAYVRFSSSLPAHWARRSLWVIVSYGGFIFGLLSKEMAITLPVMIVLFDLYQQGSLKSALRSRGFVYAAYFVTLPVYLAFHGKRFTYGDDLSVQYIAGKLLSLFSFASPAHAFASFSPTPSISTEIALNPVTNFLTMCHIGVSYLGKLVWPRSLQLEYCITPVTSFVDPRAVSSLALLSVLAVFAVIGTTLLRKRYPLISLGSFGIVCLFVLMLPVSNIYPLYNVMAERYLYLPSFAYCLTFAVLGLSVWLATRWSTRFLLIGLVGVILTSFTSMTLRRNADWYSDETLFAKTSLQTPAAPRVWYNLGYLAHKQGRLEEAMSLYQKTLALQPRYVEARTNLAAVYEALKQPQKAILEYETLLIQRPDNPAPYLNLANLYATNGNPQKAIRLYQDLFRKFPWDLFPVSEVYINMAKCYAVQNKSSKSKEMFSLAWVDEDKLSQAYFDLGKVLDNDGRYEESISWFQKALDAKPGWAEAMTNIGVAYHHLNDLPNALTYLNRSMEADPHSPVTLYNLGVVQNDMNDLERASKSLEAALRVSPKYEDASYTLGVVYQRLGRWEDAISSYEKAHRLNPKHVESLSNMGGCYLILGQIDKAEKICRDAIRLDPRRAAPYVNLGNIHQRRGRYDLAVASYQNAIRVDPIDVMAYNNLGISYIQLKDFAKARQCFQSALQVDPRFVDAYFNLGILFKLEGNQPAAVRAWQEVLKLQPDHSRAMNGLKELGYGR
ncbi:MAG TPA: tetratricopeptide repeat protein [Elusimicrobiota bacterium]|nr:tetratricopeptide repeat protein [Elusimicrobiota bacterium]